MADKFKDIRLLVLEVDGILTDGCTWQDQDGQWRRLFSVRDGLAIRSLFKAGVEVAILTSVESQEVRLQAKALKIRYFQDDCADKKAALDLFCKALNCEMSQVAFMSADVQDQALMSAVGLALTAKNAGEELKQKAHYITRVSGGDGAVREVCQKILTHVRPDKMEYKRIVNV